MERFWMIACFFLGIILSGQEGCPEPEVLCDGNNSTDQICIEGTYSFFSTIQAALDAAVDDQTVWVGPGTYFEHDLSFSGKAIILASSSGPAATIIDGEDQSSVFVFTAGESLNTELRGFTITGGYTDNGGGIYFRDSSAALQNLIVQDNTAFNYGGGIYLENSNADIINCTVVNNVTPGWGGGLYSVSSTPTIVNTILSYNGWYNIYAISSTISLTYSDLSQPLYGGEWANHNLTSLDSTITTAEPGFMSYDADGLPTDMHLAATSPLIDAGNPDPGYNDVDGTRNDLGAYGGSQ